MVPDKVPPVDTPAVGRVVGKAPVSPEVSESFGAAREEEPALIAHGENDTMVPFSQGQATRDFWIAQNGCRTQTAAWAPEPACVEYLGCQPDLPVVWCVHDGAHAWPSLTFGCDADGGICIDGGTAIWAFFSSFH